MKKARKKAKKKKKSKGSSSDSIDSSEEEVWVEKGSMSCLLFIKLWKVEALRLMIMYNWQIQ